MAEQVFDSAIEELGVEDNLTAIQVGRLLLIRRLQKFETFNQYLADRDNRELQDAVLNERYSSMVSLFDHHAEMLQSEFAIEALADDHQSKEVFQYLEFGVNFPMREEILATTDASELVSDEVLNQLRELIALTDARIAELS